MNYQHDPKLMYQDYSKKDPDIYSRTPSSGEYYYQGGGQQQYRDDYQSNQGYQNMQPQYMQGGYDDSQAHDYQGNYMQSGEPSHYNNYAGSFQPSQRTKDSSLVNQGEIDSRYKGYQSNYRNPDTYRGADNLQTVRSEFENQPPTIYAQNEEYDPYQPKSQPYDLHSQLRNNQVYDQNEPFNEEEFQAEMDQEPEQIYQYKNREAFFHTILKDKFLSRALEGINFAILAEDEFAILLIWTAPLRTRLSDETIASKRARSILGVDTIQAQGLIRKTETQLDNLISIVESFHEYNKTLPEDKYMLLLRNCTYSIEKAVELAHNLKELSGIWFSFKRELQIKSGANAGNQILNKPMKVMKQNLKNSPGKETVLQKTGMDNGQSPQQTQFGLYNLEILLRMLPYWDVPINTDTDDSATVRKLFSISRSESQEMVKRLEVGTIGHLIDKHSVKLINQQHKEVEILLTPCFFGKVDKTRDFVKALARIAWEKASAHPSFFKLFRAFTNLKKLQLHPTSDFKATMQSLPFNLIYPDLPCEIFIAGGEFPITKEQVNSIFFNLVLTSDYKVNTVVFFRNKLEDSSMIEIKKFLSNSKWKGVRNSTKGLYSLEMEYNNIQPEGFSILADVFQENIIAQNSKIANSLISTTLRILILDNNSLGEKGAIRISSFLDTNKCLIMLSLSNNNIGLAGSEAIAKSLTTNMHLKYLSLAFNPLDNFGVTKLAKALRGNKYLETLDLFDVYFNDEGCVALADALAVNSRLRTLILGNTEVNKRNANILTNTATNSKSLRVLRWSNLKDLPDEPLRMNINKLIIVEKTAAPISRIPVKCGILHQELLMDVLKFQLPVFFDFTILKLNDDNKEDDFQETEDPTKRVMKKMANITNELVQQEFERQHELFRSYFTFILQYWDVLKRGDLHNISDRPDKSFKYYRKNEDLDRVLDEIKSCIPDTQADDLDESMRELKRKAGVQIFNPDVDLVSWNEQYYKLRGAQTRFSAHSLFIDLKYYGFEPDKPDAEGISATAECVVYGNVEAFQMLMENKVNVNQVHNLKGSHFEGFTLYHFAVLSKTVDMIKYLLENKVLLGLEVYINQRNAQGDTAGQLAVRLNKLEHARILKEYGCETSIQGNGDSLTQSQHRDKLLSIEDPEMMRKLERDMEAHRLSSKTPLMTKPNSLRLIDSIIWNDEEAFMQILTQKYNLNERDADNMTALHHALFNMKEHMAAALIERGCDVNLKDKKGMTPLHVAVLRCSPDVCRALLAHSANINAVNNDGNTPLHLAAKRGRSMIVRLLVEWNADPHIFNLAQRTPAQYCDDEEIRRFIALHEKSYGTKKAGK